MSGLSATSFVWSVARNLVFINGTVGTQTNDNRLPRNDNKPSIADETAFNYGILTEANSQA